MVACPTDPSRRVEVPLDGLPVRGPRVDSPRLGDRHLLRSRARDHEPDRSRVGGRKHSGRTAGLLASEGQRKK